MADCSYSLIYIYQAEQPFTKAGHSHYLFEPGLALSYSSCSIANILCLGHTIGQTGQGSSKWEYTMWTSSWSF